MTDPREFESAGERQARSRLRLAWRVLALLALVLALLPIPVTGLQLLPSYRIHAKFLVFYTPLVSVLALTYLFYIRDSLARFMLADVLDPLPPRNPYYREGPGQTMRRIVRRLRRGALTILPGLLLVTSLYCGLRYVQRLKESVAVATRALAGRAAAGQEVGFVPPAGLRLPLPPGGEPTRRAPADSLASTPELSSSAGQFVLNNTGIDLIPHFGELTLLYIGAFGAALVALVLMALKEYAKDSLGLTEAELVLRRRAE